MSEPVPPSPAEVSPLSGRIAEKFPHVVVGYAAPLGDAELVINKAGARDFFSLLKFDSEIAADLLLDITAIDWLDTKPCRFEVVYHLVSIKHSHRLRVRMEVSEDSPSVESVVSVWSSANWLEREVFDMYGIKFEGHPDLRRILMYEEFEGHPLRKDYPVQGKQPRGPMLHPEVRNTAVDMQRSSLVAIRPRGASR